MKMHLVMTAAAAAILLTSAALAASAPSSSNHPRRAGDRYTLMTDNEELMCKVAGTPDSRGWVPPQWANAITHLRQEGDIRCTPSMTYGMSASVPRAAAGAE